ncbi:uncharacterized protein LOC122013747 [Zingiber officinale]|uniref:Uncharacterized protein n=1 Tax=Zingiber officinale TaxID=94328 RepID=A0A8J5F9H4_ZINOF|nr:uncharacterized protein LOC122013747 [Zingiber officinale]KAG6482755.1 hypothetical protein ZIOFF_059393 [Zingiber officinale]
MAETPSAHDGHDESTATPRSNMLAELIVEEDESKSSEMQSPPGKAAAENVLAVVPADAPHPPAALELAVWHLFSFSSYFVQAFLLPVLFPLMITQRAWPATTALPSSPGFTERGVRCSQTEMFLYQRIVSHSIVIGDSEFSPLQWTTISWAAGIAVAVPVFTFIAHHLDHGDHQPVILIGTIVGGALCCLLTGFFNTNWLFPVFIAVIAFSSVVGSAAHVRHLGLMVRGLRIGTTRRSPQVGSFLSSHGTAVGSLGAAVIAAFTYHMLRRTDQLTSLWVVFIFSGLQWLTGVAHAALSIRPGASLLSAPTYLEKSAHVLAVFKYPHAVAALAASFFSSFACMCIFAGGTLYIIGDLCIRPLIFLFLWLIYFTFPVVALPLLHPLQLSIRADSVRMQLLGFFMAALTSGLAFYFKDQNWAHANIIVVGLLQSAANGVLHASEKALLVDCSPSGKEGAFAMWLAWLRAGGECVGFAVGTSSPGNIKPTFAAAFLAAFVGVFLLIFGNVSSVQGMAETGHVSEEVGKGERPAGLTAAKLAQGAEGRGLVSV